MQQVRWPRRAIAAAGVSFEVADDQRAFWERFARGAWEPATLDTLGRLIDPGTLVLDLGAWVGPTTLYAAARGASVVAVEPDPVAFEQLRHNLGANPDFAGRVEMLFGAAAAVGGEVRLGARREAGDSMASVLLAASGTSWGAPAITPLELSERVGRPERLVVKMDIEGAEYDLLPALAPLLATPGCALVVSFHPELLGKDATLRMRKALSGVSHWRAFPLRGETVAAAGPGIPDPAATSHRDWLLLGPGATLGPRRRHVSPTASDGDQAASLHSRGARR